MSLIVIDIEVGNTVYAESLNFEKDFPKYATIAGAVFNDNNPAEAYSYPSLWLDALDEIFSRTSQNLDLSAVAGISSSGQQHASVWLNSRSAFGHLNADKSLSENLSVFFSQDIAPIWMDTSTSEECAQITSALGGAENILKLTGSVQTERFTGAQIRKVFLKKPKIYDKTKLIHLNSSFIASVLSGTNAPIDFGDGAGMNLMNIESLNWDLEILDATAKDLSGKLPKLSPSNFVVGDISKYFCDKYGFDQKTQIVISTGDNPSSLVGLGAMLEGSAAISLGTSDTYFAAAKNIQPALNAHIFGNPAGGFMNLICFKNGSLSRERVKSILDVSWDYFDNTAFETHIPKADNCFVLPFFTDEISPKFSSNNWKFCGKDEHLFSKSEIITSSVESQFMNMFLQAKKMSELEPKFIILTGGASKSEGIAQTIADIFAAPVCRLLNADNSAALGAALRAANAVTGVSWETLAKTFCHTSPPKQPRYDYNKIYRQKLPQFSEALQKTFALDQK